MGPEGSRQGHRQLIDTHAHLDDAAFDADRDEVMARARAAGVHGVVVPAVEASGWARLRALATAYGWKYALGTHPHALPRSRAVPADLAGACAVGECGLDGGVGVPMAEQIAVLEGHLAVAREAGLPVLLHGFRAHGALVATLRKWAPVRGVLHSYSGGPELVREYVALGLHLSFAGPITWANARKPLESLRRVPRERLLAETDAPDQCPAPHRGRSEPAFLPLVVAAMERLRDEPLADALAANARALGLG